MEPGKIHLELLWRLHTQMTVQRVSSERFNSSADLVADALADILAQGQPTYQYRGPEFTDSKMKVTAIIRPNSFWLLSTRLYVDIESQNSIQTLVTTRTKSQWFIMGDIFNYYNSYLEDLLNSLRIRCSQIT